MSSGGFLFLQLLQELPQRQHALHRRADGLHIVEQHEQKREGANETHHAEHLLDGHHQHLRVVGVDAAAQRIGYLAAQTVAVETRAHTFTDAVADEAADGEGHEERGELNEVLQVDGHRGEEDGIAEGAQECGQPQPLDIQRGRDVEIHHDLIRQQGGKADTQQLRVLKAHAWQSAPVGRLAAPEDGEDAACRIAQHLEQIELLRSRKAPVEHATRQCALQGVGRGVHYLGHEEHGEDGHKAGMGPHLRVDIRMADVEHATDADRQCNREAEEDGPPKR